MEGKKDKQNEYSSETNVSPKIMGEDSAFSTAFLGLIDLIADLMVERHIKNKIGEKNESDSGQYSDEDGSGNSN
ncbi:MAG: hypothetical protein HY073_01025 [Deltaproteobacteria bacterium]|nr:hypothetical protein [Deltaproteobacteria bacterium]